MEYNTLYDHAEWVFLYTFVCMYVFTVFFGTLVLELQLFFRPGMYLSMRCVYIFWNTNGRPQLPEYVVNRSHAVQRWVYDGLARHGMYTFTGLKTSYEHPVMFVFHPHGIFTVSWLLSRFCPDLRNVYGCVANIFEYTMMPRVIDLLFANGGVVTSADKSTMTAIMKKGCNIAICPGGFEEASLHIHTENRLYIQNKKGFIKMCMVHGYKPVIVFGFGENNTYYNLQGMRKLRLWFAKKGIPTTIFCGFMYLFPRSSLKIRCILSDPIDLPHIPNPTIDDVRKYHSLYITSLKQFYENYRNDRDVDLVIN